MSRHLQLIPAKNIYVLLKGTQEGLHHICRPNKTQSQERALKKKKKKKKEENKVKSNLIPTSFQATHHLNKDILRSSGAVKQLNCDGEDYIIVVTKEYNIL